MYAGLANFKPTERFVIHQDLRVSPVLQPHLVLGWKEGKLVFVNKQNQQESLIFSKFKPTFPWQEDEYPLLLTGDQEGKGLRLSGQDNQQKGLYGQGLELCEAQDPAMAKVFMDQ